VGKRYCIVYHHALCDTSYPYNFLVAIFKKLPIYYYAMLDKIYTVEATYFLRKTAGLFDFGRLYKLFERKLENIEKYRLLHAGLANSPASPMSPKVASLRGYPINLCRSFRRRPRKNS
jgi:hypothetical protein